MPVSHNRLQETARELGAALQLPIPPAISYELLEALLAERLEILAGQHLQQFVSLLYKIDVPENKVRKILEGPGAAGNPWRQIAALVIERQLQKTRPGNPDKTASPDWQDC